MLDSHVRTLDGRWAIIEATRLDGLANTIAVTVRDAGSNDVLAIVSRSYGLSDMRAQLVSFVLEGLDTRQLPSGCSSPAPR